jgi:sorting nexin-29
LLPKLANDLSKVLFAIPIDQADFNVSGSIAIKSTSKAEPIVSAPPASRIKSRENYREIQDFDETTNNKSYQIPQALVEEKPSRSFFVHETEEPIRKILGSNSSLSSSASSNGEVNLTAESPSKAIPGNPFDEPETEILENVEVEEKASLRRSVSSITSSSVSTVSSKPSENIPNTNNLVEQKLKERILELEAQVVELQLENARLKNLMDAPKITTLSNFTVAIPKAVLKKSTTKNYYTYEIIIKSKFDLDEWTIFKRYRDFYQLHKKLKKENILVKALDFPPKKKIGNMDFEFVEQRRQRLQVYLRHLISLLPEIASCDSRQSLEEKFPFLK